MRFLTLSIVLVLFSLQGYAQLSNPVQWKYAFENISENRYRFNMIAQLDSGWHIYSQDMPDAPVQRTKINFEDNHKIKFIGSLSEKGNLISKYDTNFSATLKYYPEQVVFSQEIVANDVNTVVKGSIRYMICNDEICLPPAEEEFILDLPSPVLIYASVASNTQSLWAIFIAGFLGGLAALFTPCVFPIIPMTVSFFTKTSKTKATGIRNSFVYSLSIIVIYVSLGFLISKVFGFDALNAMSTNAYFNLFFFLVLFIFALSFLGAFEIVLPGSFVNKVDGMSERGGFIGIFFMAFTLSLVSFSCTGPIIGTLLFESAATGNISGPIWGMVGFSSALAIPFGFFAAFPGWLKSLPKSGSWLNSVKITLGFLELALALKFLSNADLVLQAGIITREVFLVIWISIFLMLGLYLLGVIKYKSDSPLEHFSVFRTLLVMLTFAFVFYLIPGLWGAPLKLVSGFTPPDFYSEWNHKKSGKITSENNAISGEHAACPNNLNCFHDYQEGLKNAKQSGKPLLLDFTGWACVNCRKMEDKVWTDSEIDKILRNDYVIVSLYVDDQRELPANEQRVEELGGKRYKIRTVGEKWSFLQASRFKINSQPYYVVLDSDEKVRSVFSGYNPDVEAYKRFLLEGIKG